MNKFEIQYIDRYYEEKLYRKEIVKANNEKEALNKFAKLFGIKDYKSFSQPFFMWENGSWLSTFKCINEIKTN